MMIPPSFAEIDVKGPDARAFVHGQLASDVQAIAIGDWRYSCYCVPDGRVQALMMIARTGADDLRLLLPNELSAPVAERLQRYRLRARCTIQTRLVAVAADTPERIAEDSQDAGRYRCDGFSWIVTPTSAPLSLPPALWSAQIALGIPWIVAATSASFLPQMLALERLGALSLRKGCFPGQEVVARTHFLGRVKRRLVAIATAPPAATSAHVVGAASDVLPSAQPVEETLAGCVLHAATGTEVAGTLVVVDANGYGLAVVAETVLTGMQVKASPPASPATFVIDRDCSETIGDALLNGRHDPLSAHGVSLAKMV